MSLKNITGCLLGTAVGDSLGLPYEGLSSHRLKKLFGAPDRHHFLMGYGMISDDTEHTIMVAQSLIASGLDVEKFKFDFAWRLRFWLLRLPAGTGLATLRAIMKLLIGFSPNNSGVFSAGNGPAMRAAILGATIDDPILLRQLVKASTRITHSDPKAEYGSFAIALAAQMTRQYAMVPMELYLEKIQSSLEEEGQELITLIKRAVSAAKNSNSIEQFADSLGLSKGVSGYVYHTVPIALYIWFTCPNDFQKAVTASINCGGDTDTVAAIVGGIIGCNVGKEGIPPNLLNHIAEWPQSISWMEKLSIQLESSLKEKDKARPLHLHTWALLPRNFFFLLIILLHGFRRLLPPY